MMYRELLDLCREVVTVIRQEHQTGDRDEIVIAFRFANLKLIGYRKDEYFRVKARFRGVDHTHVLDIYETGKVLGGDSWPLAFAQALERFNYTASEMRYACHIDKVRRTVVQIGNHAFEKNADWLEDMAEPLRKVGIDINEIVRGTK